MRAIPLLALAAALLTLSACDSGGDGPTIGGTYSAPQSSQFFAVSLTIPEGVESDPDETFQVMFVDGPNRLQASAVYDDPDLVVDITDPRVTDFSCTVVEGGDALACVFANTTLTLRRE